MDWWKKDVAQRFLFEFCSVFQMFGQKNHPTSNKQAHITNTSKQNKIPIITCRPFLYCNHYFGARVKHTSEIWHNSKLILYVGQYRGLHSKPCWKRNILWFKTHLEWFKDGLHSSFMVYASWILFVCVELWIWVPLQIMAEEDEENLGKTESYKYSCDLCRTLEKQSQHWFDISTKGHKCIVAYFVLELL